MDILIDILQSVLAGFWNSRYTEYIIHLRSKDGKSEKTNKLVVG